MKKTALGRGLSAILPDHDEADDQDRLQRSDRLRLAGRVADVDVSTVRPNPYQPRKNFDEKALDELAASILQLGVIQPITVRTTDHGFEIISGERRLRAARRAGLKRIPAYVREADSEAMLEMAIVENIQREELNAIEIAVGYQRLLEECDLTQEQVAQKVGKNRATVANFLRLLKLPPRIQASLRDGGVSVGHARALINIEDEELQLRIFSEIEQNGLSVREVEERVRMWRGADPDNGQVRREADEAAPGERPDRDSLQIREFTSLLRNRLSTQVKIRHKSNGGHIEIQYYSNDDLERLLDLILAE
ncbi:MAG: ParB/RepB/Spo0J family partition protein [Rhodothermales bacterium]